MVYKYKGSLERELIKYTRCLSGSVRSTSRTRQDTGWVIFTLQLLMKIWDSVYICAQHRDAARNIQHLLSYLKLLYFPVFEPMN